MFNVAGEVIIKGDHGAQVLGGAVIDAKQGIALDSGVGRLIVEAGATQSSSKNSSASIGVSYGAGGLTFSAGASKGQSKGTSYSPVQLITDGTLTIRSQGGADFLGVVTDVNKVDVGVIGDVNVVTLQNQFHSKSSGFGVSFTYGPGMATGSGISASSSKTDRVFTANQTSIIGKEQTIWNVSGNTNLVGSVVAQGTYDDQGIFHDGGNMVFNSGSVSYTHLNDKDISKSISGGINIGMPPVGQPDQTGSGSGTLSIDFSTTKGLTLATLGQGNITLGAGNIDGINRDVNGSQIITEHDVQRGTITVTPEMLTDPVGTVGKIGSNLALMGEQVQHIPEEIKGEINRVSDVASEVMQVVAKAASMGVDAKGVRKVEGDAADQFRAEKGLPEDTKVYAVKGEDGYEVLIAFDGTWNDRDRDAPLGGETNVAILADKKIYLGDDVLYHKGVGTGDILDQYLCGLTGCGSEEIRTEVRDMLIASYNEKGQGQPLIIDNLCFSRGCANALELTNELLVYGLPEAGLKPGDITFRSVLMFDSVAAMGDPSNGINLGYDMTTSSEVGTILHATANQEKRRLFDLMSLGYGDGTYPSNVTEQGFLGVHSDIGGGWRPGEQGKDNGLASMALGWMHDKAVAAGVPFAPLPENRQPSSSLQQLYNTYLQTGQVSQQLQDTYVHAPSWYYWNTDTRSVYYPNAGNR